MGRNIIDTKYLLLLPVNSYTEAEASKTQDKDVNNRLQNSQVELGS